MRSNQLLLISLFLSFALINFAQKPLVEATSTGTSTSVNSEMISNLPFSRGKDFFTIMRNINFTNSKPTGGTGNDHTNELDLNLEYNYFIIDHLGIGAEFDGSFNKSQSGSIDNKNSNWILYGNIIYGQSISNDFNLYGKFSAGFGKDKFTYNSSATTDDLFAWKFEVGSPIRTCKDDNVFVTPYLSYDYFRTKETTGENKDHSFNLGLKFQNYSMCSEYTCDMHHGCNLSRNAYDPGRNFLGYNTMGSFGFGSSTFDPNNGNSTKDDNSGGSFDLNYGHYFVKNFAIGADLQWNSQTQKNGGSKYTNSDILFTPMITLNAPAKNCWNNLFIEGGYGFGSSKSTSGTNTNKENLSSFCLNLGYNDFFSKHLSLTPKIGYEWEKQKDKTTDTENKQHGLEIGIGVAVRW